MAHRMVALSQNQMRNLKRVRDRQDISTIAAVDLEALRLVFLRETNDGTEVWLTDRGKVTLMSGSVAVD